jgi:fimbrial chaperone protein
MIHGIAGASEFAVNPIRLELGPNARSGVIGVRNEGKEKISFQMQAMQWTQDAQGQDQYAETQDLVFFPKLMTVEGGEEGVIRIGTRFAVVPQEKTYRLFIEELPGANKPRTEKGPLVNVMIRFAAPIFVRPLKPEDGLELQKIDLSSGELSLVARNSGNQHQVVEGIQLKGTDRQGRAVYALTLADRYLLAGSSRRYSTIIPKEQCAQIAQLAIEFRTDKVSQTGKLEVGQAMCQ